MPIAPVWRMKKEDIVRLGRNKCRHGHTYLEHYGCYLQERPDGEEKIGFFDIEASNLAGDYGIVFTYCIKEQGTDTIYSATVTKKDLATDLDKRVIEQCIKDISRFDRLITYYGTGFDLKFIRTRAEAHGLDFPDNGEIYHTDLYYIVRNKFKLASNRLENACKVILGKSQKTRLEPRYWIMALQGDKESLTYILDHCKKDVLDLEDLYDRIIKYKKVTDLSI